MQTATLNWKRAKRNRAGSRYWESRDGRYMVHCSERCYGVELSPVWQAWFLAPVIGGRATWRKISRHRTRKGAVKACEKHRRMR